MRKRTVFLVDKSRELDAAKILNEEGITFSYNDRFYFDFRTAVVTAGAIILLIIIF